MQNIFPPDRHSKSAADSFERLYNIIRTLRGPNGCPWDKEQTPLTLKNALIEEAYETVEAINEKDSKHIMEELGDVLLVLMLTGYIEEQDNAFSVSDLVNSLSEKLIRRHPHVFGDSKVNSTEEVLIQWDQIKAINETRGVPSSTLDTVPKYLPSMDRAFKLQKKAAKSGFDWQDYHDVIKKIREELDEVEDVLTQIEEDGTGMNTVVGDKKREIESELGDLLFASINLVRKTGIHPNEALSRTNSKFYSRFSYVEKMMKENNMEMTSSNLDEMERLWLKAKKSEV